MIKLFTSQLPPPCSMASKHKIFDEEKKYFMRICNENKIYMKYSLFWWLNFGTLKQFMMTMPFLTSIQLCLNSLYSDLHLKILLLFVGNQLKAEKVRLAISPHPVQQSRIWLNCPAAEKNPGILRKRNFLVSDNTTDFEKTTIQAHSALSQHSRRRSARLRSIR